MPSPLGQCGWVGSRSKLETVNNELDDEIIIDKLCRRPTDIIVVRLSVNLSARRMIKEDHRKMEAELKMVRVKCSIQ